MISDMVAGIWKYSMTSMPNKENDKGDGLRVR